MSPLKGAFLIGEVELFQSGILLLLFADVLSRGIFAQSNCRDEIPSGPELFSREILLPAREVPCDRDGALALEVPDHVRYREFGRNADAHMDMIRAEMPFHDLRLLVPCKLVKHLS